MARKRKKQPSIDDLCTSDRRRLLYWAVIEHYRTWFCFDGVELALIKCANGELDRFSVRRIGDEYSVSRNIPRIKDDKGKVIDARDEHAKWIADKINGIQKKPASLTELSGICKDIANDAGERWKAKDKKMIPASGVSKLIWFRRPDGWSMFDNIAATGLGIPKSHSIERMLAFYKELSDRHFNDRAQKIGAELSARGFEELFGERVIDKYLMLCGGSVVWGSDVVVKCKSCLMALPKEKRRKIKATADSISKEFAVNLLHK